MASSGYVLQWSMYTGPGVDAGLGATHLIVRNNTGMCGTVNCKRRGMPRYLRQTELPLSKGDDPVFMRHLKLLVCAWHDTKRLTMLSSLQGNSCVQKRIRLKQSETSFREINLCALTGTTPSWEG